MCIFGRVVSSRLSSSSDSTHEPITYLCLTFDCKVRAREVSIWRNLGGGDYCTWCGLAANGNSTKTRRMKFVLRDGEVIVASCSDNIHEETKVLKID